MCYFGQPTYELFFAYLNRTKRHTPRCDICYLKKSLSKLLVVIFLVEKFKNIKSNFLANLSKKIIIFIFKNLLASDA